MLKKFLSALLVAVMLLTLVACADDTGSDKGITKENLKIGVIHIGDPADGSGYSYTHDLGIVGMQKALGLDDSQIVRKNNVSDSDKAAIIKAIEECISQGCNVIFGTSYGYMDAMNDLAKEHTGVMFFHGTGYLSNGTNFYNYFGRIYQARYLAGVVAGLKTETNKIGYVAAYGTELAETSSGINAFALGVQSVNPDAEVYVKSLNSWFSPTDETAYAEALISLGCDVIAQHCDTSNPQLAAQNNGVFGIGYNSDMSKDAPNAVLTSVVWDWSVYYTAAAQAVIDGKVSELGNYYKGYAEGLVNIASLSSFCDEKTQSYVEQVEALLKSGEWDVFTNTALSFNDEGKVVKTTTSLKDNKGNVVVSEDGNTYYVYDKDGNLQAQDGGKNAMDGVITGTMNYFVAGVELK